MSSAIFWNKYEVRRRLEKVCSDHETLSICHDSHYEWTKRDIRCHQVDLVMHKETIDKHSQEIVTLHTDSGELKGRMKTLEELRDKGREAESQNVVAIDQLGEKMGLLATEVQTLRLRSKDLEVDRSEEREKLKTVCKDSEENTATSSQLKKENQLLRAQVATLAEIVNKLVTNMTSLSAWKEQVTKQQERHEQILIHSNQMQERLAEILSSMNQDQQYLKQEMGLLCERQGLKIEKPGLDFTAPFKALLGSLGVIKQTVTKGAL